MLFDDFQAAKPALAGALAAMVNGSDVRRSRDDPERKAIASELKDLLANNTPLDDLYHFIWQSVARSPERFLKVSVSAYREIGVTDDVQEFIGQLWCVALRAWDEAARYAFLELIARGNRFYLFEALDFSPPIFQHVPIGAEFMASWLKDVRKAVGNDLYQRGLWRCLQNYAKFQPAETLQLIESSLAAPSDSQFRSTLARMLCWVRQSELDATIQQNLDHLEKVLREPGGEDRREIYFESWAYAVNTGPVDERRALALRDEFLDENGYQLPAWTFLLAQTVGGDRTGWRWAYRELMSVTRRSLDSTSRGWVISAALAGWADARTDSQVSRDEWAELFFSLAPVKEEEGGIWQRIEHMIVDALGTDPDSAQRFLIRLAGCSGRTWARRLEQQRDHFTYLHQQLLQADRAQTVVTALCLSPDRSARRVGVKMFAECGIVALKPEAIATATAVQLELLILQATARHSDYPATARLHASIAQRVDEIGGDVADRFYDEVIIEAMNTHGYRESLEKHAKGHAKLLECLKDANRRLDATIAAVKSPALQMRVPGRERAEHLSMRRMARLVEKGAEENSIVKHLCTTVPVLYSHTWRMLDAAGNLTSASAMQRTEVKMEMPRLEIVAPERMRLRRLVASSRISQLQRDEEAEE